MKTYWIVLKEYPDHSYVWQKGEIPLRSFMMENENEIKVVNEISEKIHNTFSNGVTGCEAIIEED